MTAFPVWKDVRLLERVDGVPSPTSIVVHSSLVCYYHLLLHLHKSQAALPLSLSPL